MLRLAAIVLTVVNVGFGLLMGVTRGAAFNLFGVPGPLPFYGDLLAVFLVGSGLGFVPAIRQPDTYRFYIWVMGVGVKLVVGVAAAARVVRGDHRRHPARGCAGRSRHRRIRAVGAAAGRAGGQGVGGPRRVNIQRTAAALLR